jgi:type II secretory pathway pseudopilin PulG
MTQGARSGPAGFTYLGVLIFIAVAGVALAAAGTVWHTEARREKEKELLFIGQEFQTAISRYHLSTPGAVKQYPKRLEDLLRDPRYPQVRRYLRKLYRDPITGTTDWGLIRAADGGIFGVYSPSRERPLKVGGFAPDLSTFQSATRYSEWVFVHHPSGQALSSILQQQYRTAGVPIPAADSASEGPAVGPLSPAADADASGNVPVPVEEDPDLVPDESENEHAE